MASPSTRRQRPLAWALALACCAVGSTGCQVDVGGQTLPSPFYMLDDIQYFAAGPEFKLTREAAALKAYRAEVEALEPIPLTGQSHDHGHQHTVRQPQKFSGAVR